MDYQTIYMSNTLVSILMATHGPCHVAGYIRGASLSLHMTYIQIINNYDNPDFFYLKTATSADPVCCNPPRGAIDRCGPRRSQHIMLFLGLRCCLTASKHSYNKH